MNTIQDALDSCCAEKSLENLHENRMEGSFEEFTSLLEELQKINIFGGSDIDDIRPIEKKFKFKKDIMRPFSDIDDEELYDNITNHTNNDNVEQIKTIDEFCEENLEKEKGEEEMEKINISDFTV